MGARKIAKRDFHAKKPYACVRFFRVKSRSREFAELQFSAVPLAKNREFRKKLAKFNDFSRVPPREKTVRFSREEPRKSLASYFSRVKCENSRKARIFAKKRAHTLGRNLANFSQISTFQVFTPVGKMLSSRGRARHPQPPTFSASFLASAVARCASLRQGHSRAKRRNCLVASRVRKSRFAISPPTFFAPAVNWCAEVKH